MQEDHLNSFFNEVKEDDIKMTDEDDKLCIWNYIGDEKTKYKYLRGCVTDKTVDKKTVCLSLGQTEEISVDDKEKCETFLQDYNSEKWKWFYSLEGTLVRFYHYENKWYFSTHKKLSAFQSRWSCRFSFGEIFIEYLKEIYPNVDNIYNYFLEKLDTDKIYYFLLRTNIYNRVICDTSSIQYGKKIIFIGYRIGSNSLILNDSKCFYLKELEKPLEIKIVDKNHILNFVEKEINPFMYQGIIGFDCESNKNVKFVNKKYKELSRIRGNNPNIRLRYLEIRCDHNSKSKFIELYPNFEKLFENYEEVIINIAKYIHYSYLQRYLKGKYVTVPKEEYIVMRKCFQYSQQTGSVSVDDVIQILNFENPFHLYKMIHRYKINENTQKLNFKKNDVLFFKNLLSSDNKVSM